MATIGTSARNRSCQRDVDFGSRLGLKFDRRKVAAIGGVREPVQLGLPTHGCKGDDAVVERYPTADHQVSAVRIGVG
jgi:hypothetical protein